MDRDIESEPLLAPRSGVGAAPPPFASAHTPANAQDLHGDGGARASFAASGAGAGVGAGAGSSGAQGALAGRGVVWTDTVSRPVPLKMGSGAAAVAPTTVLEHLRTTRQRHGHHTALRVFRNGEWAQWTFSQYYAQVMRFSRALLALGFQRFDAVNIIGFNSPEWVIANMGTIAAGGIAAGVYTTSKPAACQYIAEHSGATVIVAEDMKQLNKYLEVRHTLPLVKALVVYNDYKPPDVDGVFTWQEFLATGDGVPTSQVDEMIAKQQPEECCTLIYTSGTTGPPKGVMLSHDNITWTAKAVLDLFAADETDHLVSYLPLSHIAAAMIDMYGPAILGSTVSFAQPDALKGSLVVTLRQVQPTILFGVPRVFEKMQEKLLEFGARNNCLLRRIGAWGKRKGLQASRAVESRQPLPWGFWLANMLVFKNVKAGLGLTRCRAVFSGAAPVSQDTLSYFQSLFLPINELYGMSECTGPQTVNFPGHRRTGTAGRPMPGTELKIDAAEGERDGEICFRGRNVFMGYLNDATKTAEALTADGFLRSGDVGYVDRHGFLHITGRRKELIITAGGENVAPVPIENMIKEELSCISQAMLIGDRRKFVSCLLTFKTEVDDEGAPTPQLTPSALSFMNAAGAEVSTSTDACRSGAVEEAIRRGIERVNARVPSRAAQVRRWSLLADDFSVPTGELTPTMKLKRSVIEDKYRAQIARVYGEVLPV